jgi:hypothetical protein
MRWRFLGFPTAALMALGCLAIGCGLAQTKLPSAPTAAESLKSFLQDYLRTPGRPDDESTRYLFTFVDLADDGKQEAIVYVAGRSWCGSGGCTTLVLARDASYKVVTKITITRLPIRVLPTKSHGWHDLAVWVQGGGNPRGYEAELSFDGKSYPSNPSVFPARRLRENLDGEIVVSSTDEGLPLYQ